MAVCTPLVLTTLMLPPELGPTPSVASAAAYLRLKPGDLDVSFGLVPIAPDRRLFAALIRRDKLDHPDIGPEFADPKIAPLENDTEPRSQKGSPDGGS